MTMKKYLANCFMFLLFCGVFSAAGQDLGTSKELAEKVPIADVHRHVQRWVSPDLPPIGRTS